MIILECAYYLDGMHGTLSFCLSTIHVVGRWALKERGDFCIWYR